MSDEKDDEATLSGAGQVRLRPTFVVVASIDERAIGRVLRLDKASVIIGRDAAADFAINDERLSRRHASLTRDGNGFVMVDLKSLNGSYVNGRRWPSHRLQDGDSVRLGGTVFRFFDGQPRQRDDLVESMNHELNNATACVRGNLDYLAHVYRAGALVREEFEEILMDCTQSLERITAFVRDNTPGR